MPKLAAEQQPSWRASAARLLTVGFLALILALPTGSARAAPGSIHLPLVLNPRPALKELLSQAVLALPAPLEGPFYVFSAWAYEAIGPRLYHAPLPDGRTLLGWSDASGNGHVSVIVGSAVQRTFDFAAHRVRGLVGHDDGGFAALLWHEDPSAMWLIRCDANGATQWSTSLDTTLARARFLVGDSRLAYGGGRYAAYFTVHGVSGFANGHEGDQLSYVDEQGAKLAGGWEWGCSHSMAQLINYHPSLDDFLPIGVSDCFPGKGVYAECNRPIEAAEGDCGGMVSLQLGGLAAGSAGWKLVFSELSRPGSPAQGIGLAHIAPDFSAQVTWLTHTDGATERDPSIARLGAGAERFLVGWRTTNDNVYRLGIIDGAGGFQVGPEEVSSLGAAWGQRDDSFRTRADGSVSWVQGEAGAWTVTLWRFWPGVY